MHDTFVRTNRLTVAMIFVRENCNQERTVGNDVKLKCFYTNANSVVGKMSELKLRAQGFDSIGVVETWATADINDAELAIGGYNMFRVDRRVVKEVS